MSVEATRELEVDDTQVSIEDIIGVLGREEYDEFEKVMGVCQGIIDDPTNFVGMQSLLTAAKLAAIRTKIGTRAQYYKTSDKTITSRRRKDLLQVMYTALEENINTLKLLGRTDARMADWK